MPRETTPYTPRYPDSYREKLDAQQAEEREQQVLREAANAEARTIYLASIAQKETEARAAREVQDEIALSSERTRLQRQWLAAHPDKTESDFLNRAWPQLRRNLLEDAKESLKTAEIERMKARGSHVL